MSAVKRPGDYLPQVEQGWSWPWETVLVVPTTLAASASAVLATYYVPVAARCLIDSRGDTIEVTDALFEVGATGIEGNGTSPVTGTTIKVCKNGVADTKVTGTIPTLAGGVTLGHDEENCRSSTGNGFKLAPGDYLKVIVTAIPTNGGGGTGVVASSNLRVTLRGYTMGAR